MILLEGRTIKKGGSTPACSHRQTPLPPPPPIPIGGIGMLDPLQLERLIKFDGESLLQNSIEIAKCVRARL